MDYIGGRVLIIEDDRVTLNSLRAVFTKRGLSVCAVSGGIEARKILQKEGTHAYDCIVTDYKMPDMSGIELINYIRKRDSGVHIILFTALGDKELVTEALRSGVSEFIEKPIRLGEVYQAAVAGIARSRSARKLEAVASQIREMTDVYDHLNGAANLKEIEKEGMSWMPNIITRLHPIGEAGGDFVSSYMLPDGKLLVMLCDVSGHDLRAGFISAYFQGMVHGMVDMEADLENICRSFNDHLIHDWNNATNRDGIVSLKTSLAVCLMLFDFEEGKLCVHNHGFPEPSISQKSAVIEKLVAPGPPLGWFHDLKPNVLEYPLLNRGLTYAWCDGVDEYAAILNVSPYSLAFWLIHEDSFEEREQILSSRDDDIMAIRIGWVATSVDEKEDDSFYEPLLYAEYTGDKYDAIEELHGVWRRSIQLCMPDAVNDRLEEMLMSVREAVLNALLHGCRKSNQESCSLEFYLDGKSKKLFVRVSDSGEGYDFEKLESEEPTRFGESESEHISMGMNIIKAYSGSYTIKDSGRVIEMYFDLLENALKSRIT